MGIQSLPEIVSVRTRIQVKTRLVLFFLSVIFCLFIMGCTDESDEHCNLGISLWKQEEYDKAISEFGKALKLNPKNAKAYYYRANTFYDSGQYSRAWDDVHAAEDLGYKITPRFYKVLCKVSGRKR